MPQLTAQYGQIVRASLVWVSLNGLTCAATCASASPKPKAATAEPAAPAPASFIKCRRETSMFMGSVLLRASPEQLSIHSEEAPCNLRQAGMPRQFALQKRVIFSSCTCKGRNFRGFLQVETFFGGLSHGVC